jgi:hypothetical protein
MWRRRWHEAQFGLIASPPSTAIATVEAAFPHQRKTILCPCPAAVCFGDREVATRADDRSCGVTVPRDAQASTEQVTSNKICNGVERTAKRPGRLREDVSPPAIKDDLDSQPVQKAGVVPHSTSPLRESRSCARAEFPDPAKVPGPLPGGQVGDAVTHMIYPAGELVSSHVRRFDSRPAGIGPVAGVNRIYAGRGNTDDDMIPSLSRLRQNG